MSETININMDILITRKTALDDNLPYYYTGNPCKHGHKANRITKTSVCVECKRMHGRKFSKLWRARHKEHDRKYHKEWYTNNAERRKELSRQWKKENADHYSKQQKEYYRENKDNISEYHRQRYQEVLREQRLVEYQDWKEKARKQTYVWMKEAHLDDPRQRKDGSVLTEDVFRSYVQWKIINELNVEVDSEFRIGKRNQIDLYIPSLNVGVEVKLDKKSWAKSYVRKQKERYEEFLGKGNVFVVSPEGTFEHTLESIICYLKDNEFPQ